MRQLTPLAVAYLLVAALVVPASPFAADDVKTEPEAAPPAETTTAPADTTTAPAETTTTPAPPQPEPPAEPAAASAPKSKPVARAASPGSVTIKDFSFGPGTITVNAGESVTWRNSGPSGHSATARDGSFNTGVLPKGKSASHTFSKAGSFSYICTPHPFMKGTVNVVAASSGTKASPNSGTASGSAAAPGSSTGSSSSGSAGSSSGASLPKTGADAGALALLGVLLLGLGTAVRR